MSKNFQQYTWAYIILRTRGIFLKIHKYFHIDVHPYKVNTLSKPPPLRLFLILPWISFLTIIKRSYLHTPIKKTTPISLIGLINRIKNIYLIVNMKTLNLGKDMCVELMFILFILQTLHAVGVITEWSQYYALWKRVFIIKLQFV